MLNSILLSAALLLGGNSMPATKMNVELQTVAAPLISEMKMMSSQVEKYLIEKKAAPAWNLTIAEAWSLYRESGAIQIYEIEPNTVYTLTYGDGILQVIVDPSGL